MLYEVITTSGVVMSVSKGKGSDNWVNEYINEVGTYSSEHIGHIGKMNSLLDSMKNSGKSSEKRVYSSFKETVDSFNKYLESNGMELSAYRITSYNVCYTKLLRGTTG